MRIIPKDPIMCLSFVNTKLRDSYSSLDDFCEDFEADREELVSKLAPEPDILVTGRKTSSTLTGNTL